MENTPPEAQEFSQERGFCTPRPKRLPEGNLEGRGVKNPRPREILRAEFSNIDILLACKCLHCAYLHHCWSIVNVYRGRMHS